jgi:cell division transport system permease protein
MKSIKNHLSLVIALVSILFSMQIFIIVDRSIESYKSNLSVNYSIVIVSSKKKSNEEILKIDPIISSSHELSPDNVISRLNTGMSKKNKELLKVTLPKFYKLKLKHYPTPSEITDLTKTLMKDSSITKVENFSTNHDKTYKLLLLFKDVISVFSISIFIVTSLLIFKELRIWQFNHSERMNVMGLFGAPIWLRSAVLFRLAIVDALLASAFTFVLFMFISSNAWVLQQFEEIGIELVIFNPIADLLIHVSVALFLSLLLALLIVVGHKEEV